MGLNEHLNSHPTHVLTPCVPDAPVMYAELADYPGAASDAALAAVQSVPIVVAARRRAVAANAKLDEFAASGAAARGTLSSNRDAVIAAAHAQFAAKSDALDARIPVMQELLEIERVAADAALEKAVDAVTVNLEVSVEG